MRFEILPFVTKNSTGSVNCSWNVEPSGDWTRDCMTGRQYFGLLRATMVRSDNPLLLTQVLEDQAKRGTASGIEAGFRMALAESVMRSVV